MIADSETIKRPLWSEMIDEDDSDDERRKVLARSQSMRNSENKQCEAPALVSIPQGRRKGARPLRSNSRRQAKEKPEGRSKHRDDLAVWTQARDECTILTTNPLATAKSAPARSRVPIAPHPTQRVKGFSFINALINDDADTPKKANKAETASILEGESPSAFARVLGKGSSTLNFTESADDHSRGSERDEASDESSSHECESDNDSHGIAARIPDDDGTAGEGSGGFASVEESPNEAGPASAAQSSAGRRSTDGLAPEGACESSEALKIRFQKRTDIFEDSTADEASPCACSPAASLASNGNCSPTSSYSRSHSGGMDSTGSSSNCMKQTTGTRMEPSLKSTKKSNKGRQQEKSSKAGNCKANPKIPRYTELDDGDLEFSCSYDIHYTDPNNVDKRGIAKDEYKDAVARFGYLNRMSATQVFYDEFDFHSMKDGSILAFCKEGILPQWETPDNESGGRYQLKNLPKNEAIEVFRRLAVGLFTGQFTDWENYNLISLHIRTCGSRGSSIQLWRRRYGASTNVLMSTIQSDVSDLLQCPWNQCGLQMSFVANRESIGRNDSKLQRRNGHPQERRGNADNVSSVFASKGTKFLSDERRRAIAEQANGEASAEDHETGWITVNTPAKGRPSGIKTARPLYPAYELSDTFNAHTYGQMKLCNDPNTPPSYFEFMAIHSHGQPRNAWMNADEFHEP